VVSCRYVTAPPLTRCNGLAGVLAGVLATVLFAPIITMGWCADAAEGGESFCGSSQTSLVGIETNVWLWVAAMMIVIVATAFVARRHRAESL
jgi:hypothetical protein